MSVMQREDILIHTKDIIFYMIMYIFGYVNTYWVCHVW
jgi:hypothetical protein